MGRDCSLGFADLFRLAKKRDWTPAEERAFQEMDQEARNAAVVALAREAGGIRTEDRVGTDGVIYTAFWLEDGPRSEAMRIVSMVPSWTETLLACGCEVVGRTRFCIHPAEARRIPVVGGTKTIDWNRVRALAPDLLLLDQEENPRAMHDESPIESFATHITSVRDVGPELDRLALRLGDSAGTASRRCGALVTSRDRDAARPWPRGATFPE